ncbi:MAG: sulfurtransferase [Gammaproteobacteria bacterium]|nr:sulfurtransferase [Gammaproteobacteria bacterium]NND54721.1 sulfurtransferase [Gammaproteobacteria bacterium]
MINEISAQDAAAALNADDTLLLDVREPIELESSAIAGAMHIPMNEIPARLDEIPRDRTVICMCHIGGRSMQVAGFLAAQGYEQVLNLAGGIEAWAQDVDPGVVK